MESAEIRFLDELRGRIMGLWALAFGGGMPLGSLVLGTLAEHVGSARALQAGAVFCLLVGSWIYFGWKNEEAKDDEPWSTRSLNQ